MQQSRHRLRPLRLLLFDSASQHLPPVMAEHHNGDEMRPSINVNAVIEQTFRFRILLLPLFLLVMTPGVVKEGYGQSTKPADSAPAAVEEDVRVYAWYDSRQPGITPMIWVRVNKEWPLAAANRVAPILTARPEGHRVLFFWHVFPPIDKRNLPKLIANGIKFDDGFYRQFFARLAELDAPVDRIVLDYEDGISIWHTIGTIPAGERRLAAAKRVLNDPAASARLPEEVRRATPEELSSPIAGRAAYVAWNEWAAGQLEAALRASLLDVASARLGYTPSTTNYQDVLPSFAVYDRNGWRRTSAAVTTESSPSLYLGSGQRYAKLDKDPRWNSFIAHLNTVRSCSANGPVVPWVSPPYYDLETNWKDGGSASNAWLWEQMIRHVHATGVDTFLYWNPGPPQRTITIGRDDALAAAVFASLDSPPSRPADLVPIPLDSDEIETGSVLTRYEEFLKILTTHRAE